jgi:hypothetical protein
MPPGQPGRGTPEGMTAASGPATPGHPANGAPITPMSPPEVSGLPLASHYRLAGQRIKDACGAAQARPGQGPVLDSHRRTRTRWQRSGESSREAMPSCPQRQNHRKTAGRNPLTPARSFRDDNCSACPRDVPGPPSTANGRHRQQPVKPSALPRRWLAPGHVPAVAAAQADVGGPPRLRRAAAGRVSLPPGQRRARGRVLRGPGRAFAPACWATTCAGRRPGSAR